MIFVASMQKFVKKKMENGLSITKREHAVSEVMILKKKPKSDYDK